MSILLALALSACIAGTPKLSQQTLEGKASFRGLSAPSGKVCWVSGSKGQVWRTVNGGKAWERISAPGGDSLDFRDVHAFDAREAFLMSAGEGKVSRIYHTTDGGAHWELQFMMDAEKGFLDAMDFWDAQHGIVVGDPVRGELDVLMTEDGGRHWDRLPAGALPRQVEGEYAFAASGTTVQVMGDHIFIATGGSVARIHHSADRGKTWEAMGTPMVQGTAAQGIFSICFWDERNGLMAGGDYTHADSLTQNLFATSDGGHTWAPRGSLPYLSCVDAAPVGVVMCGSTYAHFMPAEGDLEVKGTGFHVAGISADQRAMYAAGGGGRVAVLPLPARLGRKIR